MPTSIEHSNIADTATVIRQQNDTIRQNNIMLNAQKKLRDQLNKKIEEQKQTISDNEVIIEEMNSKIAIFRSVFKGDRDALLKVLGK